jgi:hypothetical protein
MELGFKLKWILEHQRDVVDEHHLGNEDLQKISVIQRRDKCCQGLIPWSKVSCGH